MLKRIFRSALVPVPNLFNKRKVPFLILLRDPPVLPVILLSPIDHSLEWIFSSMKSEPLRSNRKSRGGLSITVM
jgi:hypothetical protein